MELPTIVYICYTYHRLLKVKKVGKLYFTLTL